MMALDIFLPKRDCPDCRFLRALYGHPEAGAFWEAKLFDNMKNQDWATIQGSGNVFQHSATRAIMVVYLDDMLLLAKLKHTGKICRALEKAVHFKNPESTLQRYFGARYNFDNYDYTTRNAARKITTDMDDYAINAFNTFKQ